MADHRRRVRTAGRYEPDDEDRCVDGSPMVAARFAHQYNVDHHREGREIRLINVEKERENFARLTYNLVGFGDLLRMRDAYDAPPRYRLIFATRNAHGTYLMNDIAAKHEAGLFKARYDGTFDMAWKRDERAAQRAEVYT